MIFAAADPMLTPDWIQAGGMLAVVAGMLYYLIHRDRLSHEAQKLNHEATVALARAIETAADAARELNANVRQRSIRRAAGGRDDAE